MPSYVETFGRVYFEAMAMGIPIICAKNSGIYGYYKEMEEGVNFLMKSEHNHLLWLVLSNQLLHPFEH